MNEQVQKALIATNLAIESVKFELNMSIPQFSIKLLKLKLAPGGKSIIRPARFEEWVSLSLDTMKLWTERRMADN